MSFERLPELSTAELVAERIREALLEGTLRPGDRLIEADIAAERGISRGPVREGIRLLAAEGIVVLRRNRGAVVTSPTFDDVLEVYVVRLGLGLLALNHAMHLDAASSPEFDDVELLLRRMRDPEVQDDALLMMDADLHFQSALFDLSGLTRVTAVLDQTARDIPIFVKVLGITYDDVDRAALIARHERLLRAVQQRHRNEAAAAWRDHVRCTVGEFARGYADAQIEGIFDLPLMHHVFDHHDNLG
ncbi:MAG: GntR family transcriptional regulator [Actinomycetota bacterium]